MTSVKNRVVADDVAKQLVGTWKLTAWIVQVIGAVSIRFRSSERSKTVSRNILSAYMNSITSKGRDG